MKLVECVPNFSEGRDRSVIESIAQAVRSVDGVSLMHVDPGAGANRTVYTLAGEPEAVLGAAYSAIKAASELIDMRNHTGVHPRMGACDVCPFVPLSGTTMDECVELAGRLGQRVGSELSIPVYLYGAAARDGSRRSLADIRRGGYESLENRMKLPEWAPDFGPAEFNSRSGATAVGARGILVAFNVNLDTPDAAVAERIAREIRTSGRGGRRFESLQAKGWFIPEYGRAQVTTNVLDVEAAPLRAVFDACRELAGGFGARVTGSEIVGMVPRRALAGDVDDAIAYLGLGEIAPFDPKSRVLEEALGIENL